MTRRRRFGLVAIVALCSPLFVVRPAGAADPAAGGRFLPPFWEPGPGKCFTTAEGEELCKPAGSTVVQMANGQVLFWDALEGTERVNLNIVAEAGSSQGNARTRVLDLSGATPRFLVPTPEDGGAAADGGEYLGLVPVSDPLYNDADLFCAAQVQLADGRIMAVGGTDWYTEPALLEYAGVTYGIGELEGMKNVRMFDPYSQQWRQGASMQYGRWYPSLVTLPDGKVFVASGVTKLIKPIYLDRPLDSGTNVRQTEVYDPETNRWTLNPSTADKSLPLYPRLHLLPNGRVYYDAIGQVFNPMGEAYDEALWALASVYDPQKKTWRDLGVPGLGVGMLPGFTGSTFSLMLPLKPDARGRYQKAEFLHAGGTPLLPTPGAYLTTPLSQINTISIDPGSGNETLSSRPTGSLNAPRWYGTAVQLPNGQVIVFNGADRDEVLLPGTGSPVMTPELFDPATETWRKLTPQSRPRTYHNTAMLLPDGRVLVGGHAPISTLYAFNVTLPGLSPNEGRDPSFEIYEPPYLFWGDRPTIDSAPSRIDTGTQFTITTSHANEIADKGSIVLVRNTSMTHLIDGDQRTVQLRVIRQDGDTITVAAPPDGAVTPPGPYMLFVSRPSAKGLIPSVSQQVFVDAPVPELVANTGGAADAQPAQPIVPRDPAEVFMDNLMDALGANRDSGPAAVLADATGSRGSAFGQSVGAMLSRLRATG